MAKTHDRLRKWRTGEGLTQEEAAVLFGVGQSALSKYEKGAIRPGLKAAHRIQRITGIRYDAWKKEAA